MSLRPVSNPANPWHSEQSEWLDAPPPAKLEIFEERAQSIIAENTSPDVGFRYSVNPYRGCIHGCAYCYARPSHQYLDFGAGTDFEKKIVVKVNAPELLVEAFEKKSWKGDFIALSGNTDCYQPLEATYRLTRRLLEVCLKYRNPVGIITKSALVRRDVDVLAALAKEARASVHVSIPFSDDAMARKIEPWAASPTMRFEAMKVLADAGVPVGVGIAPIIPGLNDSQIPAILRRAKECGATSAFRVLLRLAAEVKPVFFERLAQEYPDRVNKVTHAILDVRDGVLNRSEFGERMTGHGPRWEAIANLFDVTCKRWGLNCTEDEEKDDPPKTFQRPTPQLKLFG